MNGNIEAESDGIRSAAGDLDKIAGRLQKVLNSVKQANTANWGKWGNDSYGNGFANGHGYVSSYHNMTTNLQNKITTVQRYSTYLKQAAANLDGMNSENADSFGGS